MSGLSPEQVIELKHAMSGLADLAWTYFTELKGQGFTDEQALRLTLGWQRVTLSSGGGEDE